MPRPHRTPEYVAWENMVQRGSNPKFRQHKDYAARGITVCKRWRGSGGFERFLEDIGPKPSPEYSLDRIDNERGYEPGNVRWASRKEQNRNSRKNVFLTVLGETRTLAEWCERFGLRHNTLRARLKQGWTPERAVQTPARNKRA